MRLDALKIVTMASGHRCLELSESVSWEGSEGYARALTKLIGARVVRLADGVEMRIWDLALDGVALSLVWNDHPSMTSLESDSAEADALLSRLFEKLSAT